MCKRLSPCMPHEVEDVDALWVLRLALLEAGEDATLVETLLLEEIDGVASWCGWDPEFTDMTCAAFAWFLGQ